MGAAAELGFLEIKYQMLTTMDCLNWRPRALTVSDILPPTKKSIPTVLSAHTTSRTTIVRHSLLDRKLERNTRLVTMQANPVYSLTAPRLIYDDEVVISDLQVQHPNLASLLSASDRMRCLNQLAAQSEVRDDGEALSIPFASSIAEWGGSRTTTCGIC